MPQIKLFIPTIGAKIKLAEDWTFTLFDEYRNEALIKAEVGEYKRKWGGTAEAIKEVTIPEGTTLTVDRIYIRKGVGNYDSITFNIRKGSCPNKPEYEKTRFWAKLSDVNRIQCEVDELWLDD